jgi:hypothetical protein
MINKKIFQNKETGALVTYLSEGLGFLNEKRFDCVVFIDASEAVFTMDKYTFLKTYKFVSND